MKVQTEFINAGSSSVPLLFIRHVATCDIFPSSYGRQLSAPLLFGQSNNSATL